MRVPTVSKSFIQYFIFAGLLMVNSAVMFSQPSPENTYENGRLFIQNFDYKTYGAHQENWGFVQDDRGIIYVANNSGILQYDGRNWRIIPTPNKIGAISIDRDDEGTIYVGLENGFGYLAADSIGQLQYISIDDKLPADQKKVTDIWKTHALSEGVYFLTLSKLYFWANDSIKVTPTRLSALSVEINDAMYFGDWRKGLVRPEKGELQTIPGGEQFIDVENYAIIPDQKNNTLFIASPHPKATGFFSYDGKAFHPLKSPASEFALKKMAYSGASRADELVIGTIQGGAAIVNHKGDVKNVIDLADGLPNPSIAGSFFDRQGGLWLALVKGISRVEIHTPFTQFNVENGLQGSVQAICRFDNTVYAGSQQGLFYLEPATSPFENSRFQRIEATTGFVWAFYPADDALLAATDKGVFEIHGKTAKFIDGVWPRVLGFHRSKKFANRLYLALQNGMYIMTRQNNRWQRTPDRLPGLEDEFTSITGDENDVIWLGSNAQGVFRVEIEEPALSNGGQISTSVKRFGEAHGLPHGEINVFNIHGRIVFSSEDGLFRYVATQDTFVRETTFGKPPTERNRYVGRLVTDAREGIWMFSGTTAGTQISVADRQPDESWLWRNTPFQRLNTLGEIRTIYPESDGTVWFGGVEGIVRYSPAVGLIESTPFFANIRSVIVKGDSLIFGGGNRRGEQPFAPTLGFNNNALRFEYAAAFFDQPDATQYQYFLEGFDPIWSNWSLESRKDYTNIPEGSYRFRVRAKNIYDQISAEGYFSFTILPPWYRGIWAYLSYALLAIVGLVSLMRWQVKKYERRSEAALQREKERSELAVAKVRTEAAELRARAAEAEKEREKEQMRSRIASDLHDEIGSNLSAISVISQILQRKQTLGKKEQQRLGDVHNIAMETANAMRDIVWFVNPANDSMEKLIVRMRETANRMLDHLAFEFNAPTDGISLAPDIHFRRNFFLIYKESLQNIVRHANASRVKISIEEDAQGLVMRICDNGCGFDPQIDHKGNGLRNFQKRAAESGMTVTLISQPGEGTTVEVAVSKIP